MRDAVRCLIVACAPACCSVADANVPWHAGGWLHRALVEVTGEGSAGVDVAAVHVIHCGLALATANDLRIFDAHGRPVPYEVAYHHPKRDSLILLRAQGKGERFAIYFGKPDATVDGMRAIRAEQVGGGPPTPGPAAQGWTPRAGLVLTTLRRPRETPNPLGVADMQALIDSSPGLDGASLVKTISHGLNPFGDSDYYISAYRGWLQLPAQGTWSFCTASNEASFSFIDGRELVHWPGRHTEQRGKYGEKAATHTLQASLHYVEYYHEEVLLYQTAFLGWKPPGSERHDAIPARAWPQPHQGEVIGYEDAPGDASVMPLILLADSLWPQMRSMGQYTRYALSPRLVAPANWTKFEWDMGDGATSTAASLSHVYLRSGDYIVTLRATRDDGRVVTRSWPLTAFPIEHDQLPFRVGDPAEYHHALAARDIDRMATDDLAELAWFHREFGDAARVRAIAESALSRAENGHARHAELHLLAIGDAGTFEQCWSAPIDNDTARNAAKQHLQDVLAVGPEVRMQLNALGRLIRLDGIESTNLQAALQWFDKADALMMRLRASSLMVAAYRECVTAMGDAYLFAGDREKARTRYTQAEELNQPVVPPSVRAARTGAFPEILQQTFADRNWAAAQAAIDEWQEHFPADMVGGAPLFYRGKLAMLRKQPLAAVRILQVAARAGRGSEFEAEARVLLAHAYRQTGDDEAYRRTLRTLIDSGLSGQWRDQALRELKE